MLTYIFGPDRFRAQQKLLQLQEQFFSGKDRVEIFEFDFDEFSLQPKMKQDARYALETNSLFAAKKVIVTKNVSSLPQGEADSFLNEVIEDIDAVAKNNSLLWIIIDSNADKRTRWHKMLLKKSNEFFEAKELLGSELKAWATQEVSFIDNKVQFESGALDYLLTEIGSNTGRIHNELIRFIAYADKGQKIAREDIELLLNHSVKDSVFDMLDVLGAGKRKAALIALRNQLKKGEDAYYILSMYAYHIRNVLKIQSCIEEQGARNPADLSRKLKMHPFVVKKILRSSNEFPLQRAKKALVLLARIDAYIKTGRIDPKLALDLFILKV